MNRSLHPLIGLGFLSLATAVSLVAAGFSTAAEQKETLVTASATASEIGADGQQTVMIQMKIHPDWHAYANPVQSKDGAYDANKTELTIQAGKKLERIQFNFPAGIRHKDGYFVYEGTVQIQATASRSAGDTTPLHVEVAYCICNDTTGVCYPCAWVAGKCPPGKAVTLQLIDKK